MFRFATRLALRTRGKTRRSAPEAFRRAQSSGECPGARTTFFLGLLFGGNVETEGANAEMVALVSRGRGT